MIAVTKGSYFFPPSSSVRKALCRKGSQGSPRWDESIRGMGEEPYGIQIWPAAQPKSRAHVFSVLPELTGLSLLPCFHRINLWSPELTGNAEVDPYRLPVDKTPWWSCVLWPLRSAASGNKRSLKAMAPHSSTLAWKIPWTEEPGRLPSMGSLRVRHDWATSLSLCTFMHWRRKWQPTPVFLPGESQGRGSLVGWHLWGHTELDTTEVT